MGVSAAYILGGGYLIEVTVGVLLSVYLILRHVQRQFNLQNIIGVLAAFSNLLGYVISTSLVALSILLSYPITQSLRPILIGHTGFTVAFFLFSLRYTTHLHKVITTLNTYKELHVLCILGVISQLIYLTTFLAIPDRSYLINGVTVLTTAVTILIIAINLFLVVLTYRFTASSSRSASSPGDEPLDKLSPDPHRSRVNMLHVVCFVTVNIVFLVKAIYDVFGITLPTVQQHDKFDVKVFLITYSLIYLCGLGQGWCHLKLLSQS